MGESKSGRKETVGLLRRVPMFSELTDEDLKSLLKDTTEESFQSGSVIIKDGSWLADLYIILDGGVEVVKRGKIIARLGVGQFFGEMAVLNDEPTGRSADVMAGDQTRCLRVKGVAWRAFLRRNPDVALAVIQLLAARLRQASWTLSELQNLPAEQSR